MSKVDCAAVEKRRQASLRMARAELLLFLTCAHYIVISSLNNIAVRQMQINLHFSHFRSLYHIYSFRKNFTQDIQRETSKSIIDLEA